MKQHLTPGPQQFPDEIHAMAREISSSLNANLSWDHHVKVCQVLAKHLKTAHVFHDIDRRLVESVPKSRMDEFKDDCKWDNAKRLLELIEPKIEVHEEIKVREDASHYKYEVMEVASNLTILDRDTFSRQLMEEVAATISPRYRTSKETRPRLRPHHS